MTWVETLAARIGWRRPAAAPPEPPIAVVEAAIDQRLADARIALGGGGAPTALLDPPRPSLSSADPLFDAGALAGRGHREAAARLLAPHRHVSARHALAHARAAALARTPEEQVILWEEAFARFPTPALAGPLATALADALRYGEAFTLLDRMIASDGRASLRTARLRLLERIGEFGAAEAAACGDEARRGAPGDDAAAPPPSPDERGWASAARRHANTLIARGDLADAAALLDEVVARRGDANDAYALTGAVLLAGDSERGAALADGFTDLYPGDARFPVKRAQLAERAGDLAQAADRHARALAADPGDATARNGLARTLALGGRLAAARDWLAACRAAGDGPWTDTLAAFVAMRAGDRVEATVALGRVYAAGARHLAAFRAAIERDPAAVTTLDGHSIVHPLPRMAASSALFTRFLDDLGRRTTLVGNSPVLIGQRRGAEIDGADAVIRLNDFRIAGFEADVGTRTDWWFSSANRQAEPDRASIGAARAILTQPVAQHVPELPAFAQGRLRLDLGPDRACFTPPFLLPLSDQLLYPGRSTGMRMILILEFVCQQPFETIGFDFFRSDALHYFDNGANRLLVGESHAPELERAFVGEVLEPLARFGRYRIG